MWGWFSDATALGLTFETLPDVVTFGNVIRQHLDGDGPVEPRIASLVHLAHPARPDGREDLVWAELVTGSQRHACSNQLIAMHLGEGIVGGA